MSPQSTADPVSHPALADAPLPLEGWYAEPVGREAAEALLAEARDRLQAAYARGRSCFACRLQEMIAHYWLGLDAQGDYRTLMATAPGERELALTDLVYGQLLLSRRRPGAMEHLGAGFMRAANLLAPRAYFQVLRRHELLTLLEPGARPVRPQTLQALLAEAGVIRRLQGQRPAAADGDGHNDTLG